MRRLALFSTATVALSALQACLDPTQATLVITTNVECGPEEPAPGTLFETGLNAAATSELASDGLAAVTATCTPRASGIHDVGDIVIFPEDGAKDASVIVVGALDVGISVEDCLLLATNDPAADVQKLPSCIVARRTIPFADHTMLEVPILLDLFCAGVLCEGGRTCARVADATKCVNDRVSCGGGRCDLGDGGGGVGGAGGAGGGPTFDCGTREPVYVRADGVGPALVAIAGVDGYSASPPYLLASGTDGASTRRLYEIEGGALTIISQLLSAPVALHASLEANNVLVAAAGDNSRQIFGLPGSAFFSASVPVTDAYAAIGRGYFTDGSTSVAVMTLPGAQSTIMFSPGAGASLNHLTGFGTTLFAVGTHVCSYDLLANTEACGGPLPAPWVDAWAPSSSSVVGIDATGAVSHTDAIGTLASSDQLPKAVAGPVALSRVDGVAGGPGATGSFWVAGSGADGSAYLARASFPEGNLTWGECSYPDLAGVVDLWVNDDDTAIYFVSATGDAHRIVRP